MEQGQDLGRATADVFVRLLGRVVARLPRRAGMRHGLKGASFVRAPDRVSGCETSLARAITWRALGRAHGLNGGSWLELARGGTAPRRSCTTLSGDRPFRTRWRRAL